ncbi:DNA-directed RNA polymerase subunit beta [Candidatus Bandiella woodruffii]|uniref:DNA-directed RNA polymerase subunit beta n=1 Tax=Candidatus Bandiella euplotis TaxID=1664265 RepID=A0ABZ0UIU5_9RICK|nr:DNA-directed RNA polymerase subunit beta [Candidatus Bandiella woodruffii]
MTSYLSKRRIRYSFGKIVSDVRIPNLIKVQKESYEGFLQLNAGKENRKDQGLEDVLKSVFQVDDPEGKAKLEYVSYKLGEPKYEPDECIQRGVNYASPLRVVLRLIVWDTDPESGVNEIKGIKEQEVYMGDVPLMTDKGTFIINGAQRVIVSQLHRSPGVFYTHDEEKSSSSGKYIYSARIIPYRGSWIDFEFDTKDILYFRIDRKRKIHVTTLLRAMGYNKDEILKEFYKFITYRWEKDKLITKFELERFRGMKIENDVIDAKTGEIILEKGVRVTPRIIKNLQGSSAEKEYITSDTSLVGKYLAEDVVDSTTGEIVCSAAEEISEDLIASFKAHKCKQIKVLDINGVDSGNFIVSTLLLDKNIDEEQALADIYKVLRPGEPSTPEAAKQLFESVFFDREKYDLSAVGRMKINKKHDLNIPDDTTALTKEDVLVIIKHLTHLKCGNGMVDDIDNLANRRVRSVGELVENQFRMGLVRMQKSIIERMSSVEIDNVMPHDLINAKALMSSLREFFGISQLSQFMDQTNPLAEITHKRRLSALGPGGLTRDRAGFEVRDVHTTHYSRICPIETPEGQNIGLISSLATYADIDQYGFIQSPYRKVKDGYVTEEIVHLTAIEEEKYNITKASIELDDNGRIVDDIVTCHRKGEVVYVLRQDVNLIDVSPQQLVSVAASLIPFLENDDANRALMGSNMQRQAVPLIINEAPFVGTGMEQIVARDSGTVILAKRSGVVDQVDSKRIVIKVKEKEDEDVSGVDIYTLMKYDKSNQGTCINQRAIVKIGDFIKKGDILADGASTNMGELALGKNILVAFMPWNGYNFEDSILLSERLIKDDVYTSVHINEYEVVARDTRLGPEEITRDIPNMSEENLSHLDEIGIVNIGAEVRAGDILVGKVTPKTESPLTPEEKLLRAIFGEKAADVRNSSLRVPPGEKGVVVDVKIFTKRGVQKDERAISIERTQIEKFFKDKEDEIRIIADYVLNRLKKVFAGQKAAADSKLVKSGVVLKEELFVVSKLKDIFAIKVLDKDVTTEVTKLEKFYVEYLEKLEHNYRKKIKKLQSGDDLPQGVLKIIKVYVANKLKIQPGDKMAGRHGNKGVVSKILPVEDMPFLDDGQPVDIVLNPLGVPSRMNIGQILETHLGWASVGLGKKVASVLEESLKNYQASNETKLRECIKDTFSFGQKKSADICSYIDSLEYSDLLELAKDVSLGVNFATPVFDGAKENQINDILQKAGLGKSGQVRLRDGRTGQYFDRKVTIGYIYMMKLDHLVDNKIHARSIGPYSLVTQQPLGGKSHFGGQRFGEMECWALQAYGAAYTLQEILTVKSDDVTGRIKAYEAIVRGENSFDVGLPESFKVMIKEIRSLGLNMEIKEREEE